MFVFEHRVNSGLLLFEKGYDNEPKSGRRSGDKQEAHAQGTRLGPFGRTRIVSAETKQDAGGSQRNSTHDAFEPPIRFNGARHHADLWAIRNLRVLRNR